MDNKQKQELLEQASRTGCLSIYNSFLKTFSKIEMYNKIVVMISGGADSDIIIDIVCKIDTEHKCIFVYVNTGVEYEATKQHIKYLEEKYNIEIIEIKAIISVPTCCKKYGEPFFSKYISEMIERLQRYNFDFANDGNKSYDELLNIYCKKSDIKESNKWVEYKGYYYLGCVVGLQWWCNENGEKSSFNISNQKWLKEFMIEYPPTFKISNKCCKYAKKLPAQKFKEQYGCDLDIVGTRQQESGIRSTQYKNCFTSNNDSWDNYRLIFFYTNDDKKIYEDTFGIVHSDCYTIWGMSRTGCFGCPYNSKFEEEQEIAKKYEPNKYKAMNSMFGNSYNYKRMYLKYKEKRNA